MPRGDQISPHEVRLLHALQQRSAEWVTSREAAVAAQVANRTARMHLLRFQKLGMVEVTKVFEGYRYRITASSSWAGDYYLRAKQAGVTLGISV